MAPILGARLLTHRPSLLLHDQNAVLGRANRLLSRFADRLALTHANTLHVPKGVRTVVTGNPVRPAIASLAGSPFHRLEYDIHLLVLGGSQGARVFSDVVPSALQKLSAGLRTRLRVAQQCRPEDLERVRAAYAATASRPSSPRSFPMSRGCWIAPIWSSRAPAPPPSPSLR